MKNSLETRLGVFFALIVIGAFLLFELIGGGALFSRGKVVKAQFANAKDLKMGDPVKLAGVQVGRVKAIRLRGSRVEVDMAVDGDAAVRTDSVAMIQFSGLLGQNFVSLTFGTEAAPLATADTVLETKEQPDLPQIMAKLDGVADGVQNMTKSFSGEEFSKLLGPLTDMIKQERPKLSAILGNLQNVTTMMSEGQGTMGRLLKDDTLYASAVAMMTNLNKAAVQFEPLATDARAAVSEAKKLVVGMSEGKGTLGRLMTDEKLYSETTTAMVQLKEILLKINGGQGSIGQLVNDPTFLKNVKLTLQKVDKATEGLEDTGPLQVLGTVVGRIF